MANNHLNLPGFRIYNTMTHKKEPFQPREVHKKTVKIFTCGPSIYQPTHIGNFRTFLFEDILVRYLAYLGYKIERVLNFTDVEDKAVDEAKKRGEDIIMLTDGMANKFQEECKLLRLMPPTYNPRSSSSVDQAVILIKKLIDKNIAYWYQGDVFYDPLKFNGFGRLFGLDMSLWPRKKKRFKKDTYPGMRWNLGDFILWHGCTDGENVCWDKSLGSGRPAWNVQDAAMATKYLGFKIDICCGGIDNLYRHHDYNIAVIEGVSGEVFAPFWLHGEHLFAYGKKMSKSIGNIIYLDDLLKDGFTAVHVRFFLIYNNYRERLNFTKRGFQEAAKTIDELMKMVNELIDLQTCSTKTKSVETTKTLVSEMVPKFEECMNNDLDVVCAINDIIEAVKKLVKLKNDNKVSKNDCKKVDQHLHRVDSVLQVIF
jgi:cysteinyl-tRNA synthetase